MYEGNYSDYLAKAGEEKTGKFSVATGKDGMPLSSGKSESSGSSKDTWKSGKKLKMSYKEQKEYETIDADIEKLQTRLSEIEVEMTANATDAGRLAELTKEQEDLQAKLDEKEERWLYLTDLAERIEKEKQ